MIDFTPGVDILETFLWNGPWVLQFTAPNLARLALAPACNTIPGCTLVPFVTEGSVGTNAYSIQPVPPIIIATGDYLIQFVYQLLPAGTIPLNTTFTLTDSLRLVLLSS